MSGSALGREYAGPSVTQDEMRSNHCGSIIRLKRSAPRKNYVKPALRPFNDFFNGVGFMLMYEFGELIL